MPRLAFRGVARISFAIKHFSPTVEAMILEGDGSIPMDQITPFERLRERCATWAALALILVFFIVTIALWGYAAWWGVMKLIGLFA